MLEQLEARFHEVKPDADFVSLRFVDERNENLSVRQDIVQPVHSTQDVGAMITVVDGDGLGYAATSDLSTAGLREAASRAHAWAKRTQGRGITDFSAVVGGSDATGSYASATQRPWSSETLAQKIDRLRQASARLKADDRIVDWAASLTGVTSESLLLTSQGGRLHQRFDYVIPQMIALANEGTETQRRTLGGYGLGHQGGLEVLDAVGYMDAPERIANEAVALLSAPDCPEGTMDLILAPDQMILQIHESIGHPLELDRILGDERNYAGTSFVTADMFGSYRYGSDLLNITFDPTRENELASYGFDDDGTPAERQHIIRNGMLERPLGGRSSQVRADMEGVANSRACSWNRPPIDRMANLNLEPGESTVEELVAQVENGVFMATNCSWSIDDSRNKFQFGCEYGRVIKDGQLGNVVKKCNYRGISATFWRNLKGVGAPETVEVMGTPNCGKGEPNQMVRVGHASPTCLFSDVEVFAGD